MGFWSLILGPLSLFLIIRVAQWLQRRLDQPVFVWFFCLARLEAFVKERPSGGLWKANLHELHPPEAMSKGSKPIRSMMFT